MCECVCDREREGALLPSHARECACAEPSCGVIHTLDYATHRGVVVTKEGQVFTPPLPLSRVHNTHLDYATHCRRVISQDGQVLTLLGDHTRARARAHSHSRWTMPHIADGSSAKKARGSSGGSKPNLTFIKQIFTALCLPGFVCVCVRARVCG